MSGPRNNPDCSDSRITILLVEDMVANQIIARKMLEKLGCRPDIASNGEEAVARASEREYDLILMDCQMPTMDGYEATRRIRNLPSSLNRETPIVAMTANVLKGDRERCLEAGMSDYVPKPIDTQLLYSKITLWGSAGERK